MYLRYSTKAVESTAHELLSEGLPLDPLQETEDEGMLSSEGGKSKKRKLKEPDNLLPYEAPTPYQCAFESRTPQLDPLGPIAKSPRRSSPPPGPSRSMTLSTTFPEDGDPGTMISDETTSKGSLTSSVQSVCGSEPGAAQDNDNTFQSFNLENQTDLAGPQAFRHEEAEELGGRRTSEGEEQRYRRMSVSSVSDIGDDDFEMSVEFVECDDEDEDWSSDTGFAKQQTTVKEVPNTMIYPTHQHALYELGLEIADVD